MASIELLLNNGKYELLLAATENRIDYKLVDTVGQCHMVVKLDGVHFKIVDVGDVVEKPDLLNEKLDSLALKVADENQTDIDENELYCEISNVLQKKLDIFVCFDKLINGLTIAEAYFYHVHDIFCAPGKFIYIHLFDEILSSFAIKIHPWEEYILSELNFKFRLSD